MTNNTSTYNTTTEIYYNVIQGDKYLCDQPNLVICIDLSFLDKQRGSAFVLAQELTSRRVVCHFFKTTPITAPDVVVFLQKIIQVREPYGTIEYIHSDRESLFNNKLLNQFLREHGIKKSRGSALGHDNQTIERLNRTIKQKMKKILLDTPGLNITKTNFSFKHITFPLLKTTLDKAIALYNDTAHSANYNMSPNRFDETILQHRKMNRVKALVPLAKDDNSIQAKQIRDVRRTVAQNFANDWELFFINWRKDQEYQHQSLVYQNKMLLEQNLDLKQNLTIVQTDMKFLSSEAEINKQVRLKKEKAKTKRQLALTLPLRDVINLNEFEYIITLCAGNRYPHKRKRLALALLYLTGLRVSNLLILTVKNLKSLFDQGHMQISLSKRGPQRHNIELSINGLHFLNRFKKEFLTLTKGKNLKHYVFTPQAHKTKHISRENFDKELNLVLKQASHETGKHLRTHSLRATVITDLLKSNPLHKVKDVIGHKDIKSTQTYDRSELTRAEVNKVMDKLVAEREKQHREEQKDKKDKQLADNQLQDKLLEQNTTTNNQFSLLK